MTCRRLCVVCVAFAALWPLRAWPARAEQPCRVVQQEKRVELCSPFFVFRLNTAAGLRAGSWQNRLTGRTLSLGDGPELAVDIGLPGAPLQTPHLEVSGVEIKGQGDAGEAVFRLTAKEPALSAVVTYR